MIPLVVLDGSSVSWREVLAFILDPEVSLRHYPLFFIANSLESSFVYLLGLWVIDEDVGSGTIEGQSSTHDVSASHSV